MRKLLLLLLPLMIAASAPFATAQGEIKVHNITYELVEGEAMVREVLLFVNPSDSKVHTFDPDIALARGHFSDASVTGVPATVNNRSDPNIIILHFSKSPIFRTSPVNSRTVVLTYRTSDHSSQELLDGKVMLQVFSGNVLPPLPSSLLNGETNIKLRLGEGFEFRRVLPEPQVADDELLYTVPVEKRRVLPAFNVIAEYGDFKRYAEENLEAIAREREEARRRAQDAELTIYNAEVYEANLTRARALLNSSKLLMNQSLALISRATQLLEQGERYQAYLLSNASLALIIGAREKAVEAGREANERLKDALARKIGELKNLTRANLSTPPSITPEPSPTPKPELRETVNRTPPTPTATAPPPTTEVVEAGGRLRGLALIILLAGVFFIALYYALAQRERKVRRLAAVGDFRSISDLKRKSYRDFEEKLVDVKKETTIAGEIRRLTREREKYALGVENIKKKLLAGEIEEEVYRKEKKRFEEHIEGLDKKIAELEKKLPKKGELYGKSGSDRPGKDR